MGLIHLGTRYNRLMLSFVNLVFCVLVQNIYASHFHLLFLFAHFMKNILKKMNMNTLKRPKYPEILLKASFLVSMVVPHF